MSELMTQLEQALNPRFAAVLAGVGGVAGGATYISFSGVLLGVVLLLGLCLAAVSIASLFGVMTGASADVSSVAPAFAAAVTPPAAAAVKTVAAGAGQQAAVAQPAATGSAPITTIESTLPPGAPIPSAKIEATETEAQMMAAGRFAEYHLAKAKRFYAERNYKEAAYQASASLAHGELDEAKELRRTALAATK